MEIGKEGRISNDTSYVLLSCIALIFTVCLLVRLFPRNVQNAQCPPIKEARKLRLPLSSVLGDHPSSSSQIYRRWLLAFVIRQGSPRALNRQFWHS